MRLFLLAASATALRVPLAPNRAPRKPLLAPAALGPAALAGAAPAAAPARRRRYAAAAGLASLALLAPRPAAASHLGDVVAAKLRTSGFSDAWIVATIAAMPVVELRGAIPIGAVMGVPLPKVFLLCVAGNMVPILPLLLALRSDLVQKALATPLAKARSKAGAVSGSARWSALAAFVGVPFPGTGAWTGAMVAFVLGMPLGEAMSSIFCGVVAAGLIVTSLAAAGAKGAAAVVVALAAAFLWKALAAPAAEEPTPAPPAEADEATA